METITVVTTQDEESYVSHCLEYDIASQGHTRKEAHENVKEAVTLFLESASPAEVQSRLERRGRIEKLSLNRA